MYYLYSVHFEDCSKINLNFLETLRKINPQKESDKNILLNKIFISQEKPSEKRIAGTPASVKKLSQLGFEVSIEKGIGEHLGWSDADYQDAGASVENNRTRGFNNNALLLNFGMLQEKDIFSIQKGNYCIGFVDHFHQNTLVGEMLKKRISLLDISRIPRSTVNQKMDGLSSQNNIDGYASIILAARQTKKIFPMMTTAAGTIFPIKVLVIGVGVAGLQAIATAKRMGAQIEAYDTRPAVAEQVRSLGAKFVNLPTAKTQQTSDGYAKKQTETELKRQQQSFRDILKSFDIIITAAKVVGGKSPLLITKEMLGCMKKNALVIDLAAEVSGNVEGSLCEKKQSINGIDVIGYSPSVHGFPKVASEMYSMNLYYLLEHFWDKEKKECLFEKDEPLFSKIALQLKNEEV